MRGENRDKVERLKSLKITQAICMAKKDLLQAAKALQEELTAHRRYLHAHAETGFAVPKTTAYIRARLEEMGYTPQKCGKAGLTATVGKKKGKVFLLRADIDGLPIQEKTGKKFACKYGNMHACGHDFHAAMLLGTARLLKAREESLNGTIKLLFQPAEELLQGAKNVLEGGVLQNPKVDGAMMLHVLTGVELPTGTVVVSSAGVSAPAADYFTVRVQGKSCHGSAPWNGVDALSAGAYILLALQEISARELSVAHPAVLTVGSLKTQEAGNVISDVAELNGTLRCFDEEVRAQIKTRLEEIAKNVAKAFRAKAKIFYGGGCPSLWNDEKLSVLAESSLKSLFGEKKVFASAALGGDTRAKSGGSEDFAYISRETPSVMLALAAGEPKKGYLYPLHHAKTDFDESVLPIGAAAYAQVATEFLKG